MSRTEDLFIQHYMLDPKQEEDEDDEPVEPWFGKIG